VKPKFKPKPKQPFDLEGHDRIQGDVLKPDLESADPNSPLYNKKVVFTGVLEKIKDKRLLRLLKKWGLILTQELQRKLTM